MRLCMADERATTPVVVRPTALRLGSAQASPVFYKQYEYHSPSWAFICRSSKARKEFENYQTLGRLGIRTAEPIACGEQRDALGRLQRAFILTRAVPGALTLAEFVRCHCDSRAHEESRKLRDGLLRQLAEMVRSIHDAHFFHNDLVWRNILVTWAPSTQPVVWWIDCPRGQFVKWSPLRRRRRLKDIALLDLIAAYRCTAVERMRFIKLYIAKDRLDASAKEFIRDVVALRNRKWPAYRE